MRVCRGFVAGLAVTGEKFAGLPRSTEKKFPSGDSGGGRERGEKSPDQRVGDVLTR